MVATLTGYLMQAQDTPAELYRIGLSSVPFLMAFGDLLIGWQLLRHAEIAARALDTPVGDADAAFYRGKVAVANYFATTVLPSLSSVRAQIENIDPSIMTLDEASL